MRTTTGVSGEKPGLLANTASFPKHMLFRQAAQLRSRSLTFIARSCVKQLKQLALSSPVHETRQGLFSFHFQQLTHFFGEGALSKASVGRRILAWRRSCGSVPKLYGTVPAAGYDARSPVAARCIVVEKEIAIAHASFRILPKKAPRLSTTDLLQQGSIYIHELGF